MGNQVNKKQELLLPIPRHLVPRSEKCADDALPAGALADFLANGLKDSETIENWITAQAPVVAGLPPLTAKEQLSSRQHIYDRYFGVNRHGGPATSMTFALGQVMGELSREFQSGSGLSEQDINHLLDGLTAVLEAVNGC